MPPCHNFGLKMPVIPGLPQAPLEAGHGSAVPTLRPTPRFFPPSISCSQSLVSASHEVSDTSASSTPQRSKCPHGARQHADLRSRLMAVGAEGLSASAGCIPQGLQSPRHLLQRSNSKDVEAGEAGWAPHAPRALSGLSYAHTFTLLVIQLPRAPWLCNSHGPAAKLAVTRLHGSGVPTSQHCCHIHL